MAVAAPVARRLYILSGNQCAFPGCVNPILDTEHGVLTGQICHIKGSSPSGPRHDASQTPEERDGFDNLILMCGAHNKVVDDPLTQAAFSVEVLTGYKRDHEARAKNTVVTEDVLARFAEMILALQPQQAPIPSLSMIIESFMVRPDNQMGIDTYDFRIKLKNDGPSTVRQYRIEVEIPWDHATSNSIYPAELKDHTRGKVRVFRFTEQGHPGFTLYPGDTSHYLILLEYTVSFEQYRTIKTEAIKVLLYSGDTLLSTLEYPLTNYLNEERLDQILGI